MFLVFLGLSFSGGRVVARAAKMTSFKTQGVRTSASDRIEVVLPHMPLSASCHNGCGTRTSESRSHLQHSIVWDSRPYLFPKPAVCNGSLTVHTDMQQLTVSFATFGCLDQRCPALQTRHHAMLAASVEKECKTARSRLEDHARWGHTSTHRSPHAAVRRGHESRV